MSDSRHSFGGDWTELKLEAISAYSRFFVQAIGGKFDLWYIDPFAGTGERTSLEVSGGLFENEPTSLVERQYPGSAARALSQDPPFAHLRLGDAKRRHVAALEKLAALYPNRDVKVLKGDANTFIQEMFSRPPWTDPDFSYGTPRALVFLDPYGMEVNWKTLEVLASCKKADVWFLVNMKAAIQQLSHQHGSIDEHKRKALRECFGTDDWEEQFYSTREQEGLLGLMTSRDRTASNDDIAHFHKQCLQRLFAYVSDPLPLKVRSVSEYFLLYCMSNNSSEKAQGLIKRGAESVIKKYKQASRRRSARQEGAQ